MQRKMQSEPHAMRFNSMETGVVVIVRPIDYSEPYPLGGQITVKASCLKPLPMAYFGGEVPA